MKPLDHIGPTPSNAVDYDNPDRWAPRLDETLTHIERMCARFEAISASQHDLIDQDETERLLAIIEQRQELLARLELATSDLEPFRRRWDELMGVLPEEHSGELNLRVARIAEQIRRIESFDQAATRELARKRTEISSELADVTRGRSALAAYSGRRNAAPRYQDREG